jgi:hypothetical protein
LSGLISVVIACTAKAGLNDKHDATDDDDDDADDDDEILRVSHHTQL